MNSKKYASGEIAKIEGVTVIYVISDKKTVPMDHVKFYNIVAASTLERILKYTEDLHTKVCVRFGHIRGFNHSSTLDYFNNRVWRLGNYDRLVDQPKWIFAENNSGIQLADREGNLRLSTTGSVEVQYAGILGAAMNADRFGNFEPSYMETIKHQIRKSVDGEISRYGIKAISANNDPKSFKWWIKGWV